MMDRVTFYIVDFNGSGSITISMKKLVTEPAYDDTEVDVTHVDGLVELIKSGL